MPWSAALLPTPPHYNSVTLLQRTHRDSPPPLYTYLHIIYKLFNVLLAATRIWSGKKDLVSGV